MGLIANFAPGSIRTVDDMVKALELALLDLFDEVGSSSGRSDNTLFFSADDSDLVDLAIAVQPSDEYHLARQAEKAAAERTEDFPITPQERGIVEHIRSEGLTERQAMNRLQSPPERDEDESKLIYWARKIGMEESVRRIMLIRG